MIIKNLLYRKIRTILTVFGIAIGIAAIVSLLSFAYVLKEQMNAMFEKDATDLVVLQKESADPMLSKIDEKIIQEIEKIRGVEAASGRTLTVVPYDDNPYFIVFGYSLQDKALASFRVVEGRTIRPKDKNAILIGKIASDNFDRLVEDRMTLGGRTFTVVGIYESGVAFEDGGGILALEDAQGLADMQDRVTMITVDLKQYTNPDRVKEEIEEEFSDLSVIRSAEFADRQTDAQILDALAWIFSLVALLVGGIGIMNTLIMSVFERTREIGVLRAVGWSRWRILRMILIESIFLSLGGALMGIVLGVGIVYGVTQLPGARAFISPAIDPNAYVIAIAIALLLGLLGGAYPAYRASRMSPLEALRYE